MPVEPGRSFWFCKYYHSLFTYTDVNDSYIICQHDFLLRNLQNFEQCSGFVNVQLRTRIHGSVLPLNNRPGAFKIKQIFFLIYCLTLTVVTFAFRLRRKSYKVTIMYVKLKSTYKRVTHTEKHIFSFYVYGTGASIEGSGFIKIITDSDPRESDGTLLVTKPNLKCHIVSCWQNITSTQYVNQVHTRENQAKQKIFFLIYLALRMRLRYMNLNPMKTVTWIFRFLVVQLVCKYHHFLMRSLPKKQLKKWMTQDKLIQGIFWCQKNFKWTNKSKINCLTYARDIKKKHS